ncbi:MAG: class I SAM-dependent methyltransferase [Candidatus Dojkabacteria bacterium]
MLRHDYTTLDLADIEPTRLLANRYLNNIYTDGSKTYNRMHIQANALALPLPTEAFHVVYSNHAIDFATVSEQTGPITAALHEANRVLVPGGYAIFYFHHPEMIATDLSAIANTSTGRYWKYLRDNSILFENEDQIRKHMSEAGFVDIEVVYFKEGNIPSVGDQWWEVTARKRSE